MATDKITYPVRYEMSRTARGSELAILDKNNMCVMRCDGTSDFEMHHVVTRLNLAHDTIGKMELMGWADRGNTVDNDRLDLSFPNWTAAIDACIEMACE